MKILLCSPRTEDSKGGIAVFTDGYLEECKKRPDVSCTLVNTATVGRRAKNGNAKRSFSDEFTRTKRIFADLKQALAESYDAFHLNTSCGTFGLFRDLLIADYVRRHSKKIRIIVHYHCNIADWIRTPFSKAALRRLVKVADSNIVLNHESEAYLRKITPENVVTVPNFLDEAAIRTTEKTIAPELKNLLFVGYVQEAKGAKEIFSLASLFPDKTFTLVGDVDESILPSEKPDNLVLTGRKPHSEIPKIMDKSDLFLFPSHSEGFSVALLEAMAQGMPVIATDVGANREMIEPKGGLICPVSDVDALAEAIRRCEPASFRKAAAEANLLAVKERFSASAVFQQYLKLYQ